MDDTRLVRLAFSESVRLAALPTRSAVRAPWTAQVASLLAVTPLPATGPRHTDIKAELSALQQRYLTSVSQSALPKVQLYLGQVADALCTDSYQMASYLKEVTSRAQLRRLAQLRTGSHQLRVETGRWERPREGRKEDLHVCPGKASWLMQGLQRERHAQNKSKPKQRHKTPNSIM